MLITLPHTALQVHPRNMRRRFAARDVRRMALSQAERARQGLTPCVHALVVTPSADKGRYTIIAGHLRHAGNVYLGAKAPPLNCEVRKYRDEAAMLADMSAENGTRAETSPLDWARHFQVRLKAGSTDRQIARESGKTLDTVRTYLSLLDLSVAAMQLIDRSELPLGAAAHLLKIRNKRIQAALAGDLAARKVTLVEIEKAVGFTLQRKSQAGRQATYRRVMPPAAPLASKATPAAVRVLLPVDTSAPSTRTLRSDVPASLADLRSAARDVCAKCDLAQGLRVAEPAWRIALAAAGQTCDDCSIRDCEGACRGCPLAEMMSRVARGLSKQRAQ